MCKVRLAVDEILHPYHPKFQNREFCDWFSTLNYSKALETAIGNFVAEAAQYVPGSKLVYTNAVGMDFVCGSDQKFVSITRGYTKRGNERATCGITVGSAGDISKIGALRVVIYDPGWPEQGFTPDLSYFYIPKDVWVNHINGKKSTIKVRIPTPVNGGNGWADSYKKNSFEEICLL